ncbi:MULTISPECIES: methyltransferase type 11 [unclassified Brevundimonas]|uniref:methyltransferase type 11 n=1 Tax=unclassified Brevundimonas TaxID=2622653 RepID=UPI0025C47571|nr:MULTISPECIES: methyltransferase type 11 [unclassified Brevundimonas]
MYKLILPLAALLALGACDSNEGVRVGRSVEIHSDSDSGTSSKGLKVISTLQCPSDQGVLTRIGSASVDGKTCTYTGPRGSEVKLHLVALDGQSSEHILKDFQTQLVPSVDGAHVTATAKTGEGAGEETADVRLPGLSVKAEGDRANISLPGMRIEADGNKANIRIGGLVIKADDEGSSIISNGATITADGNGATVKSNSRQAIRATMIHAMSKPDAEGWRVVGYEARGPGGGPMVVATFRTRDRDEGTIVDSVRELVLLNVGD